MILGKNHWKGTRRGLSAERGFQRFSHYKQFLRNSYGNHFLTALTTFKHNIKSRIMLKNQYHDTNSIKIGPLLDDWNFCTPHYFTK